MRLERVGVSDTGQVTSTGVSHVRVSDEYGRVHQRLRHWAPMPKRPTGW
jgi:hypothetical protein